MFWVFTEHKHTKMTKTQTLKVLNDKIDLLIISGKTSSNEFKRLMKLHKLILKK